MCWQTYCCHCSLSLSAGWVPAADCWSCLGGTSRESLTSSHSHSNSHSPTPSPLADQVQAWYTTDLKRLEGTFCPWLPITGLLFRGKVCRTVGEGESLTHPFPGSLAGALIDLPVGTQQVASEVKKKRQKESGEGVKYSLNHGYNGAGKTAKQCEFVSLPSTTSCHLKDGRCGPSTDTEPKSFIR